MNPQSVLVLGATGKVGSAVIRSLIAKQVPVKALVRDPAKARDVLPEGVALLAGDLEQPATLQKAMKGVEKVFLATPNTLWQVAAEKAVIDAARAAGVQHVVKLSGGSAHPASPVRIARWHGEVERYLEASGLAFTHLQPEFFMQNLLGAAASVAQGVLAMPLGVAPFGLVDARDIAAVAAGVLTQEGHAGNTYRITGPEALSMPQIAHLFSQELGREVEYTPLTAEAFIAQLTGWGVPRWSATALAEVFVSVAAGNANFITDAVATVGGGTPRTFRNFVREHLSLFAGQPQTV
ncbi:MAG TPA: SDR family oxidoreductase [Cytophagales bacterium]